MNDQRKISKVRLGIIIIGSIWIFTLCWLLKTWRHLTLEQLIYQLKAPIEGTGASLIWSAVIQILIPVIIVALIFALLSHLGKEKLEKVMTALIVIGMLGVMAVAWKRLEIGRYVSDQMAESKFIEDNYIDPAYVDISFPVKKRNLIYIYLESMETTYASKEEGGAFEENCIPELTKLAQENEDFSGEESGLNGGYVMSGATWTMGALFAQTSGLPLKISIGLNNMDTQESFFPGIITLGDILDGEGYKQIFMIGSDATFGGRKLYFSEHGNYEIWDYNTAKENGKISKDYYEWWGYEDRKLFAYAKEKLTELAEENEPFNLTLLTADTHFPDGYKCDLCKNEFGGNQYANVMACSSRQVSQFIDWVKKQPFYENTTIVLVGDHLTMDDDFCEGIEDSYQRRVLLSYINAAVEPLVETKREYTAMDQFPTTLAALGVTIAGERLGLGTNLFSTEQTVIEKYGIDVVKEELNKRSGFMEKIANVDAERESTVMKEREGKNPSVKVSIEIDAENQVNMRIYDVKNMEEEIEQMRVSISKSDGEELQDVEAEIQSDRSYLAKLNYKALSNKQETLEIRAIDEKQKEYQLYTHTGNLLFECETELGTYLSNLNKMYDENYAVFIAINDEATLKMTDFDQEILHQYGFRENIKGTYRTAYLGVFYDGKVKKERFGAKTLRTQGILPNGKRYEMSSSGYEDGSSASIQIDGVEYAINERGFNIVVYDMKEMQVIDQRVFDTWSKASAVISVQQEKRNVFLITVSEVNCVTDVPENVMIRIWDKKSVKKPREFVLDCSEEGKTYKKEVKLNFVDKNDFYVEALAIGKQDIVTKLAEIHEVK